MIGSSPGTKEQSVRTALKWSAKEYPLLRFPRSSQWGSQTTATRLIPEGHHGCGTAGEWHPFRVAKLNEHVKYNTQESERLVSYPEQRKTTRNTTLFDIWEKDCVTKIVGFRGVVHFSEDRFQNKESRNAIKHFQNTRNRKKRHKKTGNLENIKNEHLREVLRNTQKCSTKMTPERTE